MPKRGMFANRHLGFRSSPDCALRRLGLERHVGSARLIDERSQFCAGRMSGMYVQVHGGSMSAASAELSLLLMCPWHPYSFPAGGLMAELEPAVSSGRAHPSSGSGTFEKLRGQIAKLRGQELF